MEIVKGINLLRVPIPDNPLGFLNCYLVAGTDGWLMVDTGWSTAEALASLRAGLKDLGLEVTDIETIVLTHVHPDHFGLAGRLKQLSPHTRILTHHWEMALIESRYIKFAELQKKMGVLLREHGVPDSVAGSMETASMPAMEYVTITMPDAALYGGEIIKTGLFELEVIWTPGHSPGHICLYEPDNQLLFAGDHILPTITPNVSYHVQSGDNPLGDYLCAIQKLERLRVAKVLPGHEDVFEDLQGRLAAIVRHHRNRKEEMRALIKETALTAYEIASRVSWISPGTRWEHIQAHMQRAAVAETVAHLELMRREGTVERREEAGIFRYRAI